VRQKSLQAATTLRIDNNWEYRMKILKLSERQIENMRIDTKIKYVTKAQVKTSPLIKGVFKWGVQAWAVTINDKKVPVKPNKISIFSVRFEDLRIEDY
jgi:hypothetical protein